MKHDLSFTYHSSYLEFWIAFQDKIMAKNWESSILHFTGLVYYVVLKKYFFPVRQYNPTSITIYVS